MNAADVRGVVSRRIPPYRTIVAVDTERFSKNPSASLPALSASVEQVLAEAMRRSDLASVWTARRFAQNTGDGYVFGVPPADAPFLIHPFLDHLQAVLQEQDEVLRAKNRELRLRLRLSLHVGPVPDAWPGGEDVARDHEGDLTSTPTNETFRLLDSRPVRAALADSDPDVTLLAAVVSQRAFEDLVLAGYTGLHPSSFVPVTADLPAKDFIQPAWLYVPRPSRRPGSADSHPGEDAGTSAPALTRTSDRGPSGFRTSVHGDVGQAITGESVRGVSQSFGSDFFGRSRRARNENGDRDDD